MLRGHFKSIAIYSLITALLASPVSSASPGAASRRAASQGRTPSPSTTTAQTGQIQQVAGTTESGSAPGLLSGLFQSTRSSGVTSSQTRSTQRASGSRSPRTSRKPSNSPANSNGILGELFGGLSTAPKPSTPSQPIEKEPRVVDWEGIPYHQAHSRSQTQQPAPIRDPDPNETRMARPRTLSTPPAPPRLASSPASVDPNLPKPPQLSPAPSSSRRTTSAQVVSTRGNRVTKSVLSPLSSSRRSGRRDVPTLDASEIAAADTTEIKNEDLVPKVSRRVIKPAAETTAKPASDQVAKSTDDKPAAPKTASSAKQEPKQLKSASTSDIAQKPEPKPMLDSVAKAETPKAKPTATESASPVTETATPETEKVVAKSATKPQPTAIASQSTPNAAPEQPVASQPVASQPVASQPAASQPAASQPAAAQPIAAQPAVGQPGVAQPTASQPAIPQTAIPQPVAAQPTMPQPSSLATQHPGQPAMAPPAVGVPSAPVATIPQPHQHGNAPAAPQFVAPNLPVPTSQSFGPQGYVAGHRVGPPASAFQPRTVPQASIAAQETPIGSGVNPAAPRAAFAPSPVPAPMVNPTPRIAQSPYQARDPYAYSAQPYGAVPVTPTVPSVAQAQPSQVAPQPHRITAQPSLGAPQPYGTAHAAPQPTYNYSPQPRPQASAVAQAEIPRNTIREPSREELPVGQSAVASELPGIRVVTHGPSSVIIRQNHEFEIRVENRGSINAEGVMIRTAMPDWANVLGQSPSSGSVENGNEHLVWTIDKLPAGKVERMVVRLKALRSGTHDLDVDWTTVPQRSVASVEVREPKLDLVIEGPDQVVFGESQTYRVRVLNPGDGIASNVMFTLSPDSPTPQTQRIGNIPSGKEAQFEIELTAQDLGDLKIHGLASGDMDLSAQAEKDIRVASADLESVLTGPQVRYQNAEAIYHLKVTNSGTATCKNVQANLGLPPGVQYLGGIDSASQRGTKLAWVIQSLPPGAEREYEFKCQMVSPGLQTFAFTAAGTAAGQTDVALDTQVESIADLVMTVQDPAAPAPVGSDVVYEIVIKNRGSRQASGIRAIAQFSNGIEPRRVEGHTGQVLTGQVLFDPIESIRPGQEVRIRVIAKAEAEGHHRFRTEIRSGETVLVAEEATQYLTRREQRVSRRSSGSDQR